MFLTISALALLGLLLALLLRFKSVGAGAAIIAVLFGFYLARTGAAASIDQLMSAVGSAVHSIGG
ncbi:hypothetical protein [Streptomyces sp. NBC_01497]|uniref:hypothetical protein n=1 Tax=Streptomyces sp. NBC_01497 TaxID=2903885 RepID=UPI002E2EA8E6|nr:hypothetical protein [Streptomyces sp. NBC_01497]